MKFNWIVLISLCITNTVFAQPVIELSNKVWDFGTITEGAKISNLFSIKNTGNELLKIDDINTSCGCTVALPGATLIKPGANTDLRLIFDSSKRKGEQKKYVEIESNDPNNSVITLTITGYVEKGTESRTSDEGIDVRLEVGNADRDGPWMPEIELRKIEPVYIKPVKHLVIFYLRDIAPDDKTVTMIKNAGESIEGKAILRLAIGNLGEKKTELMVERLNAIKCDALILAGNGDKINKELAEQLNFPVCPTQQPYIIKDFKRLKVGIIASVAIEQYMVELKRKSDLIVVINDINLEQAKKLASEVEGIDIIIASEGEESPIKIGKTIIAPGGKVGKLKIFLDITREIIGYHGKVLAGEL